MGTARLRTTHTWCLRSSASGTATLRIRAFDNQLAGEDCRSVHRPSMPSGIHGYRRLGRAGGGPPAPAIIAGIHEESGGIPGRWGPNQEQLLEKDTFAAYFTPNPPSPGGAARRVRPARQFSPIAGPAATRLRARRRRQEQSRCPAKLAPRPTARRSERRVPPVTTEPLWGPACRPNARRASDRRVGQTIPAPLSRRRT